LQTTNLDHYKSTAYTQLQGEQNTTQDSPQRTQNDAISAVDCQLQLSCLATSSDQVWDNPCMQLSCDFAALPTVALHCINKLNSTVCSRP